MKTIRWVLLAAVLAMPSAFAEAAETNQGAIKLNIDSQPIDEALLEFSRQTGVQVVLESREVGNSIAPRIAGRYTPQAALQMLLANSGLDYEYLNERTVAIRAVSKGVPAARLTASTEPQSIQLSQAVLTRAATEEKPQEAQPAETMELEEVVVTGSHIRGGESNISPVIVLDKKYIESTGIGTVSRLIESLPQNFALTNQAGTTVPGSADLGEQGTSINLRGVGEGTTLVLVNGRRLAPGFDGAAVDISALPLQAIDRVEILTDGASALYGSDAVGGVVNFILKRDFKGAQTQLRSGWADGEVNEYRIDQALGNSWSSGNALLSLGYYKRDLLPASERDFVPSEVTIGSLYPQDKNYSAMFSGRQGLDEKSGLFADVLYTRRDSYNESGETTFQSNIALENPQLAATLGLDRRIGTDWRVEMAGSYARNKMDISSNNTNNGVDGAFSSHALFEIRTAQLKADGPVFTLPGGPVRAAVGVDWRDESFHSRAGFASGTPSLKPGQGHFDQIIRSVFGELAVPVVGAANATHGVNRLQLSLAGRFDDYSTFGSSFDPKVGLMWEPVAGLQIRGHYSTSYVAPTLPTYSLDGNLAIAFTSDDPGAPGGSSHQLELTGVDKESLTAQEATSKSFGFEFSPASVPDFRFGMGYYDIHYEGRIASPPLASVILGNPSNFGSLFIREPSVAQVEQYIAQGKLGMGLIDCDPLFNCNFNPASFDAASIDVLIDTRKRNLSETQTRGVDVAVQHGFETSGGRIELGLNGTYIIELIQKIAPADAPFDRVDTFYNPPDWRARASLGWQRHGWAANLFVNHTDSYSDNRVAAEPTPISSYTTVDVHLGYDFAQHFSQGLLAGVTIAANVQNLLDRDPPHAAILESFRDMGFDPTNADPMGRLIALELLKSW